MRGVGAMTAADGAGALCVIVNPGSRQAGSMVEELRALLGARGADAEIRVLRRGQSPAEAAQRAVRDGFATVAAAGGDGTASAVASGLVGTDRRFGVLPLGTFNYFARSLGLPETLEAAAAVMLSGATRTVSVGEVNGLTFLNNASLGVYPAILGRREGVYRRWGRSRIAAHWSAAQTLATGRARVDLQIEADGRRRIRTPLIFVCNNGFQLESLGLEGADTIRRGAFAVLVAPDVGRAGLVRRALALGGGMLEAGRDYDLLEHAGFTLRDRRGMAVVACDGERARLRTPLRFRRLQNALRVAAPPEAPE